MITIRLTRIGRKNSPAYRIVIANTRSKRDGKMIEYVGSYNTTTDPKTVSLNKERIKYWLSKGAQVSATVKNILIKEKLLKSEKNSKKFQNKPGKKKQAQVEKQKTETKEPKKEEKTEKQEVKS